MRSEVMLLSVMIGKLKKIVKKIFKLEKENPYFFGPSILLTNFCNENCGFCFAKQIMKCGGKKEISLEEFSKLLDYFERNGSKAVYLLGGEPTQHSNFKQIIKMAVDRGFEIEIFTNGIFSKDISDFLIKNISKIRMLHINIATPSYIKKETKDSARKFIKAVSTKTVVNLVITIDSFEKDYLSDLIYIGSKSIHNCVAKIGVAGLFIWSGGFSIGKNRKIGNFIFKLSKELINKHKIKEIFLTQIMPCMFSKDEFKFINTNKKIKKKGYSCYAKSRVFELKADFNAIKCFGMGELGEFSILDKNGNFSKDKNSMTKIHNKLNNLMISRSKKQLPDECANCKYHGYKKNNCPGPCLIR